MRPKVFIGSSKEGLDFAYAVQGVLRQDAEITVWDQTTFDLSKSILSSLFKNLEQSDFGIFILAPDDLKRIRGKEVHTPRDNVIFELGLFLGRLGPNRTFFLTPGGVEDLHLPSDLSGIISAIYDPNRQNNINTAVEPACSKIRQYLLNFPGELEKTSILINQEEADSLSGIWYAAHLSRDEEGSEAFSVHTYDLTFHPSGAIYGQMRDRLGHAEYEFKIEGRYIKASSHIILILRSQVDWLVGTQFHYMFKPNANNVGVISSFDRQNRPFSTFIVLSKNRFTKQDFEQAIKGQKISLIINSLPSDLPDLPEYLSS